MRKECDSLAYFNDVKERNKVTNRLKYHRKKNQLNTKPIYVDYENNEENTLNKFNSRPFCHDIIIQNLQRGCHNSANNDVFHESF